MRAMVRFPVCDVCNETFEADTNDNGYICGGCLKEEGKNITVQMEG